MSRQTADTWGATFRLYGIVASVSVVFSLVLMALGLEASTPANIAAVVLTIFVGRRIAFRHESSRQGMQTS